MRVLILFAHPALEKSRVHRRLVRAVADLPEITFHDLYEAYPDFQVDIAREQAQLSEHDLIVFQHPIYWYSPPALLKQWMDLVLQHGWAYGSQGNALVGKQALSALSTGGAADAYQRTGFHGFTLRDFLVPIERSVTLCKMEYLPPFAVHGTHRLDPAAIERHAQQYRALISAFRDDRVDLTALKGVAVLNDVLAQIIGQEVQA